MIRHALVTSTALFAVAGINCAPITRPPPLTRAVFPTGLALVDDHLLIVSSTADGNFDDGALLSADLALVRGRGVGSVVTDAVDSAVVIPPLAEKPRISPLGDRVLVPVRGVDRESLGNGVVVVDVGAGGALSCSSTPCTAASLLRLQDADPFAIEIVGQSDDRARVDALVTSESSPHVTFFSDDRTRSPRLRVDGVLDLGSAIFGVRAAVRRPSVAGTQSVVIAAAELSATAGLVGAQLLVFAPRTDTPVASFDLTAATGSLSVRGIALVPGDDGDDDALVVALREPDAFARFAIEDAGSLPTLRLEGLAPACRGPLSLALWSATDGEASRLLATCETDDAVESLDPRTLEARAVARFAGRNPYDVVVDAAHDHAYVSFFLDDSVGQFNLAVADGPPILALERRVGAPLPKPEDGRN